MITTLEVQQPDSSVSHVSYNEITKFRTGFEATGPYTDAEIFSALDNALSLRTGFRFDILRSSGFRFDILRSCECYYQAENELD